MRCECCNLNFKGLNFRLKQETLDAISKSTRLTHTELLNESLDSMMQKAQKRGALKKQNTIKNFLSVLYKKIGKKLGLLNEERLFYTDVD